MVEELSRIDAAANIVNPEGASVPVQMKLVGHSYEAHLINSSIKNLLVGADSSVKFPE